MKDRLHQLIYRALRKLFKQKTKKFVHGKRFYSNSLIDTLFPELIEIGDEFISAPGSIVLAHDASPLFHKRKYRVEKTIIGNRVFLGANSVVLPGVTIGDNVIVGSGAIVTKDIPSNVVVAGNPARVISTVEEYLNKCNDQKTLYDVPLEINEILNEGDILNDIALNKLRVSVYKQLK